MIFKVFSQKKIAKILAFFAETTDCLRKNLIITLVFEKNANFFRRKLGKIAENWDRNIDPWQLYVKSLSYFYFSSCKLHIVLPIKILLKIFSKCIFKTTIVPEIRRGPSDNILSVIFITLDLDTKCGPYILLQFKSENPFPLLLLRSGSQNKICTRVVSFTPGGKIFTQV
jgi:hypothetical protein